MFRQPKMSEAFCNKLIIKFRILSCSGHATNERLKVWIERMAVNIFYSCCRVCCISLRLPITYLSPQLISLTAPQQGNMRKPIALISDKVLVVWVSNRLRFKMGLGVF